MSTPGWVADIGMGGNPAKRTRFVSVRIEVEWTTDEVNALRRKLDADPTPFDGDALLELLMRKGAT